jgi:hypothetical protein
MNAEPEIRSSGRNKPAQDRIPQAPLHRPAKVHFRHNAGFKPHHPTLAIVREWRRRSHGGLTGARNLREGSPGGEPHAADVAKSAILEDARQQNRPVPAVLREVADQECPFLTPPELPPQARPLPAPIRRCLVLRHQPFEPAARNNIPTPRCRPRPAAGRRRAACAGRQA